MKKLLSAVFSAVMTISALAAPVHAEENTTPSGISYENIGAEIESLAKENEKLYASFGTAVFSGDEVLYSNHFGYIDRENQVVADENAVYEWGSISKMFVWVSVMQLYEQGKLDLNTDIQAYLPDGFLTKLKYDEPITMMNLINHNAGWQETTRALEVSDEAEIISLDEALKKTEPAQTFKPGEITAYSNWGAALAGYIVECVSGMDYAEYVHENILEPLGMEQTSVGSDYRDNEWVRVQREKSKSYMIMDYEGMSVDENLGTAMSFILLYPAGSVTGTLADITKFAQAFVSDDSPLFENRETLDLMLSASDCYGDSDIPKNCHGLWVAEYAVRTMGHGGNTNGGSANLVFDKESKMGVVVVTNQQSEGVFCHDIPKLIFGSIENNPIYAGAEITNRSDVSGSYIMSRGVFEGAAKIISCLGFLKLELSENPDVYIYDGMPVIERFSDNMYRLPDTNDFLYETTTSDGKTMLEYSSMAYIQSDTVSWELTAVIVFAAVSVINLIILIVEGMLKLAKKGRKMPAGKAIFAGQLAKLIMAVSLVLGLLLAFGSGAFSVLCIIAGLCGVICLISAVFALKAVVTEKEMKMFTRVYYTVYALCSVFAAGFAAYFELFNFWM